MAKARMLHKKISISLDVHKLSLPAKLLFTWMIPHADDEGKLRGEPTYIKATVVPMISWSLKLISSCLIQMKNAGLIYYWQENNEWFIQFRKWEDYQHIRKNRFQPSKLPSFNKKSDNQMTARCQPNDVQKTPQSNISEYSSVDINKSENKNIADKKTPQSTGEILSQVYDPYKFQPKSNEESEAKNAWLKLEPNNPRAFFTTYLKAVHDGLPASYFYAFVSEIKQSKTRNPGAVFNSKVKQYLNSHKDGLTSGKK